MKIALISLNQYWENKERNCCVISELFQSYIDGNSVDLVILPEMTLTGFTMNPTDNAELIEESLTINFFKGLASKYSCYICFGLIAKTLTKYTNNAMIVSPEGDVVANYEKIHPFSYAGEDKVYASGNKIEYCNILGFNIGLSICYDLRFPELFQSLSKQTNLIINIANWPSKRVVHWNVLLQARAIENQIFMIGVNRIGNDANSIQYEYSSRLFHPNGEEIKPLLKYNEVDIYDIDLIDAIDIRANFPVKNDRKIEFYKSIL